MKFNFRLVCTILGDELGESTTISEFDDPILGDVQERIQEFLRGCGYYIPYSFEENNQDSTVDELLRVQEELKEAVGLLSVAQHYDYPGASSLKNEIIGFLKEQTGE